MASAGSGALNVIPGNLFVSGNIVQTEEDRLGNIEDFQAWKRY
jgi:hypothetical protein